MTPLTMPQSAPTKLKASTEAARETTAARFLFPRRRCSGRWSARGVSGTAIRRRRGVVRRFRVASTSSTKLSTSCVSYPWPTGARQKAIARTSSGVRCYASSNAPRQRPGRHRPHPSDSRGSWREDLKTRYGKRLQRSRRHVVACDFERNRWADNRSRARRSPRLPSYVVRQQKPSAIPKLRACSDSSFAAPSFNGRVMLLSTR